MMHYLPCEVHHWLSHGLCSRLLFMPINGYDTHCLLLHSNENILNRGKHYAILRIQSNDSTHGSLASRLHPSGSNPQCYKVNALYLTCAKPLVVYMYIFIGKRKWNVDVIKYGHTFLPQTTSKAKIGLIHSFYLIIWTLQS